ncbi:MAG: hypothetical protein QM800_11050 [Paludibacter sp.]
MKKYLLVGISTICIITFASQKHINIYKSDLSVLNVVVSAIDSLKFSSNNTQLDVYKSDNSTLNIPVSSIDSMTFTDSISQQLPVISTLSVTAASYTTAQAGYTLKSIGGTTITEAGICWSTTANPTIAANKINSNIFTPSANLSLSGLPSGSTIYVRAYATNSYGTSYGEQVTFQTTSYSLPVVETLSAVYNYTTNKATCLVNVKSNGDALWLKEVFAGRQPRIQRSITKSTPVEYLRDSFMR